MEVKLLTTTEELIQLKESWEALEQGDRDVTYYSTFRYLESWWHGYFEKPNLSLFILCAINNRKVVGIAPLILANRRVLFLKWNELRFMGKGDFSSFITDKQNYKELKVIRTLFKAIEDYGARHKAGKSNRPDRAEDGMCSDSFETRKRVKRGKAAWHRIRLTHIRQGSSLARFLLSEKKYNNFFKPLEECPSIDIRKYRDCNEYFFAFLSGDTKDHLKCMQREKGCALKVVRNSEENVYESIAKLHMNEQSYLRDICGNKYRRSLYEDSADSKFLQSLYGNNENIITFMLLDGESNTVSYRSCYLHNRVLHCWNIGFNPAYKKYNSGRILHFMMMRYLCENRIADILDLGAGRYCWKFEWTGDCVMDYTLDVWNTRSLKGRFIALLHRLTRV
ncbi:MAG: GNAT family N-acetyltransferase [Eubacteriales bacterium]|nr:GNAT family N-acetyltransferase [Eubacteriales bacterium]